MAPRWIIGLASGRSCEGVDAALVELSDVGLDLRARALHHLRQPFGQELRDLLQRVVGGTCETRLASLLHRLLGETFAAAARQVADQASFSLQKVQCIGCSGHILWHEPDGRFPSVLSAGMTAVVAERTGISTVGDFRARDVAAGGQGAPLSALADYLLFRSPNEGRLLVHLGSTSRVVHVPAGCRPGEVVGFEAGPCNGLLDSLMQHLSGGQEAFDNGGKYAVQGCCLEPLLQRWLAHSYLQRRPPKGLPRHVFGAEFAAQAVVLARQNNWAPHDLLCTAAHFVARAVTSGVEGFLTRRGTFERTYLSGGGIRNGLLWRLLDQQLGRNTSLDRTDAAGVPSQARKAIQAAMLAALTLDGVPANLPSATGAAGSRLLGSLTPGSAANWSRCLAWMAAHALSTP